MMGIDPRSAGLERASRIGGRRDEHASLFLTAYTISSAEAGP